MTVRSSISPWPRHNRRWIPTIWRLRLTLLSQVGSLREQIHSFYSQCSTTLFSCLYLPNRVPLRFIHSLWKWKKETKQNILYVWQKIIITRVFKAQFSSSFFLIFISVNMHFSIQSYFKLYTIKIKVQQMSKFESIWVLNNMLNWLFICL